METLKKIITMPSVAIFIFLIGPAFLSSFSIHVFTIAVLLILSWLCLLANILNAQLEETLKMRSWEILCFNALLFVVFLYSVKLNYNPIISPTAPLIILHSLLFVGILWILYVVSRTLVFAETQKNSSKSKLFFTLILFWMFPVGVFFLQPRIIRVLAEKGNP